MAERVRNALVAQIQGLLFRNHGRLDARCCPLRHDQFSFVVRHIVCSPEQVELEESGPGFRRLDQNTGEGIAEGILAVSMKLAWTLACVAAFVSITPALWRGSEAEPKPSWPRKKFLQKL